MPRSKNQGRVRQVSVPIFGVMVIAAVLCLIVPSPAYPAGTGDGYGGPSSSLPGGYLSILVAKYITHAGGRIDARIDQRSRLSVEIPYGMVSRSVQCIISQDRHPDGPRNGPQHSKTLLMFSVLVNRGGKPIRIGTRLSVSYAGPNVSNGTFAATYAEGKFEPVPGRVVGHAITFTTVPGRTLEVVGI